MAQRWHTPYYDSYTILKINYIIPTLLIYSILKVITLLKIIIFKEAKSVFKSCYFILKINDPVQ
jgi:hypothetical protein